MERVNLHLALFTKTHMYHLLLKTTAKFLCKTTDSQTNAGVREAKHQGFCSEEDEDTHKKCYLPDFKN